MKIVRSLKPDLHPSIVPFYSFVVTPSYALITMWVYFPAARRQGALRLYRRLLRKY